MTPAHGRRSRAALNVLEHFERVTVRVAVVVFDETLGADMEPRTPSV
jgi:hypothetical protein